MDTVDTEDNSFNAWVNIYNGFMYDSSKKHDSGYYCKTLVIRIYI